MDDYSPLRQVDSELLAGGSVLFPVRRTHWYVPRRPQSCAEPGCIGSQGDAHYVAPNPPYGAVFTYYLAEARQSLKDRRSETEKPLIAENADVVFPTWDDLDAEALEDAPAIVFTISDMDGNVIRHIEADAGAGFHRVAWDLRYPVLDPWLPEEERGQGFGVPAGVLAAPGRYQVSMQERIGGQLTDLGQRQTFDVVSIREPTLPGSSQEARIVFARRVDEMARAVDGTLKSIDEVLVQLGAIKESLQNSTADLGLYVRADALETRITGQRDRISGNRVQGEYAVSRPVPITARLSHAGYNPHANAYGPTPAQRDSLEIAQNEFRDVGEQLTSLIDGEYRQLLDALDAAGVPWTPGRGVLTPNP
jgi:hypothetical protein